MKRLLCKALLITLWLCSCSSVPEETAEQTETVTETEAFITEPVETDPEETASAHEAVISDGFKISRMLKETKTENSGESVFSIKENEYRVSYESCFYGPQSMIDRDSHHMGDLFVAAKYATEYPQDEGYIYGEFTGDRFSDYITYNDSELKIYQGKGKYARYNEEKLLYTQKFDIDGTLRGTGDFNGDGFTDLLFITEQKTAFIGYGSENGFELVSKRVLPQSKNYVKEDFCSGDMNGDGLTDIIAVKGFETSSWIIKDGKAELFSNKQLNIKDEYNCFCITDVNTDGFCDLIVYMEGVGLRSYYGRKDGQFGPYENEIGNKNLYPTWETSAPIKYMTPGDTNEDGVSDIVATMKYRNNKDWLVCSLTYPTEAPAYDYSTTILKKDDGTYILYNGGLYVDYNKDKYAPTDGDHVLVYTSDDGVRWHRNLDAPAFYLGGELGTPNEWWSGNTIEPEVICVDGTYYMYWQCENYTHLENGTLIGHDYIGVATSTDGLHFERKTDKPVIINEPEYSSFDHEEVLYYPDDPDGRPYWLFVRHVIRNTSERFCRIRSDSPYEFDYSKAERLSNFNGLGNQTGWLKLDNGETLFVRITIVERGGRTTPALQFSSDGLKWSGISFELAGVDKTNAPANTGKNIYFVGFSTINGTGEIERLEDGRYRFIYGGCTSETPVAPQIFYSSVGCGECIFSIK